MNTEAMFGTDGMIRFIAALRNRRDTPETEDCRFPIADEWKTVDLTCTDDNARNFFVRLIDDAVSSGSCTDTQAIESCQLDEGVALFMELKWRGDQILHCSIQVVATPESDLETLYLDEACRGVYYRFDYSIDERGKLFDHPFPHVHSVSEGAPRFQFPIRCRAFPPFAFIEFVMINHHYEKWLGWVLGKYAEMYPGDIPENERTPDELLEAYKEEVEWLKIDESERGRFLRRFKSASTDAIESKSANYPRINPDHLALNYWQECLAT